MKICVYGKLPSYMDKKRWSKNNIVQEALKKKLVMFRARKYVIPGEVKSLLNMFDVPKGVDDICLVNDATQSGLNEAVWAPNFFSPTVSSLARTLQTTSWMADVDVGKCFCNYPLEERLQPYVGVDVTEMLDKPDLIQYYERWVRALMGF